MVFKYAVVTWFNYRKELSAGFLKGFEHLEEAKVYAYDLAHDDMKKYGGKKVITEDEITDDDGPGKSGSPYDSIVGYGGRNETGYSTRFYCVVEWFDGVTNYWDDDIIMDEDEWYPRYYY